MKRLARLCGYKLPQQLLIKTMAFQKGDLTQLVAFTGAIGKQDIRGVGVRVDLQLSGLILAIKVAQAPARFWIACRKPSYSP